MQKPTNSSRTTSSRRRLDPASVEDLVFAGVLWVVTLIGVVLLTAVPVNTLASYAERIWLL